MAAEKSAGAIQAEYLDRMGCELGPVCYELWNQCVWIHWRWDKFLTLYGTSPESVDILNRAAPAFFADLQGLLWEEVLLRLARLTDAKVTGGQWANLTVRLLPDLVPLAMVADVRALVDVAVQNAEFAKSWRNQRIAHLDRALALNDSTARPLPPATRKHVEDALGAVAAVLNYIQSHSGMAETIFDSPLAAGSAEALLRVLRDGLDARDARRPKRI